MGSYVFKIATQEPERFLAAVSEGLGVNSRIARQIQEQMPAPEVTEPPEPKEFGSIIRARCGDHGQLERWMGRGDGSWASDGGTYVGGYLILSDVEIVRVGLGRDEAEVKTEAIRELAEAQRETARTSLTQYGVAEATDFADWLDERANHIDPRRLEGAHP